MEQGHGLVCQPSRRAFHGHIAGEHFGRGYAPGYHFPMRAPVLPDRRLAGGYCVHFAATDVATATPVAASVFEIIVLVVASAAAGLLFERLRVPAGLILGAALASAALGLGGVVHGGCA